MSHCFIKLDNYEGEYLAGSLIKGRFICQFHSPKNIRGIHLKFIGEEKNEWKLTQNVNDGESTGIRQVAYSGYNIFLNFEKTLMGTEKLDPGTYEFPFTLKIPRAVPGTYRGRYGGISFSIKCKVDRPFKFDFKAAQEILVVCPIDLNFIRNQLILGPVSYSINKTFSCFWIGRGVIAMDVHLKKKAFVVGEEAKVQVDVVNSSNQNVVEVNVQLLMEITSKVTSPGSRSRTQHELLAMQNGVGVRAHGQEKYNFALKIPHSVEVPSFSSCKLFTKEVQLKVTAVLSGWQKNMRLETHVALGHIPVHVARRNDRGDPYLPNSSLPTPYIRNETTPPSQRHFEYESTSFESPTGEASEISADPPSYSEVMASRNDLTYSYSKS